MQQTQEWLIWSNEHCAWWKPNYHGYTKYPLEAGQYTSQEAMDICESGNKYMDKSPNECMVHKSSVKELQSDFDKELVNLYK